MNVPPSWDNGSLKGRASGTHVPEPRNSRASAGEWTPYNGVTIIFGGIGFAAGVLFALVAPGTVVLFLALCTAVGLLLGLVVGVFVYG